MNRTCGALMLALALIGSATGCKKHETEPNASASSSAASPGQAGQREATLAAGLTKAAPFSTLAAKDNPDLPRWNGHCVFIQPRDTRVRLPSSSAPQN